MPRYVLASIPLVVALACGAAGCQPPPESSLRKTEDNTEGKPAGQFGDGDDDDPADAPAGCVKDASFYDVPGDGCDNDGDGEVDNPPSCDGAVGSSAADFARAMGICDDASERGFGLVSATFTQGYGTLAAPKPEQHGVLSKFGDVLRPREGKQLGVLSTGFAQEFDGGKAAFAPGKEWWLFGGEGAVPPGFPKAAGDCPQSSDVNDVISLKLELKAPKNASGLKFDFNFHSSEWPEFICSRFNDGFIAYLSAKGFNGGTPDNISFDAKNNPVSVNNGFFDRCTPGTRTGCSGERESTSTCPAGAAELAGTGFGLEASACGFLGKKATQGGATGWLSSQASVEPGETFTLELMIWDTGDGRLDSSVLLDNFHWLGGEVATTTERPDDVK
ncbi:MAG: choice-of-anchor L domain-containing protein [Labilithrix sp.]|nr:choice-of-anchor L domain-containing protein [Labilithrix sp.]MCW5835089.1 choice-of-anchor L domain-containing protein [Labilithrix sp.]